MISNNLAYSMLACTLPMSYHTVSIAGQRVDNPRVKQSVTKWTTV